MTTPAITPDQSIDDLEAKRKLAVALSIAAQQAMGGGDGTPDSSGDPSQSAAAPTAARQFQPNQNVVDLRKQADAIPASGIEAPADWKQSLLNVATKILPLALTARFAGTAAGAGAAEGSMNANRQFALDQQNRRQQLLQQANEEQTAEEKQREFDLEDQDRNNQIAAAAERAKETEADRQSDLAERAREFQISNQGRISQESSAERRHQEDLQEKQREFNLNQNKPTKETGTFSLAEDGEGNPVLFNSKTGDTKPAPNGLHKPSATETTRADLSENVNENLDSLEDIVRRRPELFGPMAGRITGVKAMLGSNDPDIAKLEMIKDNLGKALQSAHGMKNALAVEQTGNAVLNSFKNGPDAILAASGAARKSVGTFLRDVQQGNPSVNTGSSNAPKATHRFNPVTGNIEPI